MELVFWSFMAVLGIVTVYSFYKLARFLINEDFSPDRYTYVMKEIDGEKVEYVVDKNDKNEMV